MAGRMRIYMSLRHVALPICARQHDLTICASNSGLVISESGFLSAPRPAANLMNLLGGGRVAHVHSRETEPTASASQLVHKSSARPATQGC